MVNVLRMDDKAIILMDDADFLKSEGHKVFQAINGEDGLEQLSKHDDVDIIFTDNDMSSMGDIDGHEFAEIVRTNPEYAKYANIPIIGIGGFSEEQKEHLTECRSKPYRQEILLTYIEQYCVKPE